MCDVSKHSKVFEWLYLHRNKYNSYDLKYEIYTSY